MKICPECGAKNLNSIMSCIKCGASLGDEKNSQSAAPGGWDTAVEIQDHAPGASNTRSDPHGGKSIFVDQSESIVATIGSNYLQNFLTGQNVSQGIGVLTQKRFYYKGKNFAGQGKEIASSRDEGIVSLEDITFTQFTHTEKTGYLMFAILLAVVGCMLFVMLPAFGSMIGGIALAASLPFFIMYFTNRQTLFVVSFPGGGFSFNVSWYPIADFQDFQRQLHLLKDQIKEGKGK